MRISDWSSDVCSSDLLLKGALGRAQVAAVEPEVGIDDADEGEVGEMIALGDELRADDDIDQPALDIVDELGGFRGRPERVRSDDRDARPGKAQRDLVGAAPHSGTAAAETCPIPAVGDELRRRPDMAHKRTAAGRGREE